MLDEKERNHKLYRTSRTWGDNSLHDKWLGPGWYRMLPPAGTKIPEQYPGHYYCGTSASGYLKGSHSNINPGQSDSRTVCFDDESSPKCKYSTRIRVRNCGQYFLYYLVNTYSNYNIGYCAQ